MINNFIKGCLIGGKSYNKVMKQFILFKWELKAL